MEWKSGKEAIYHIEILPKNFNFKNITNRSWISRFYLNTNMPYRFIFQISLLKLIGIHHAHTV